MIRPMSRCATSSRRKPRSGATIVEHLRRDAGAGECRSARRAQRDGSLVLDRQRREGASDDASCARPPVCRRSRRGHDDRRQLLRSRCRLRSSRRSPGASARALWRTRSARAGWDAVHDSGAFHLIRDDIWMVLQAWSRIVAAARRSAFRVADRRRRHCGGVHGGFLHGARFDARCWRLATVRRPSVRRRASRIVPDGVAGKTPVDLMLTDLAARPAGARAGHGARRISRRAMARDYAALRAGVSLSIRRPTPDRRVRLRALEESA